MSEVMTCSTVDEKFSFSEPKSNQIQSEKESETLIGSDAEDESTVSFNDKLDVASNKSSENTICGSDDSVVSHLNSSKNSANITDEVQDSANSTIKSDTSCGSYEYLMSETSVNATYNNSQSNVHNMKQSKNSQNTSSLTMANDIDNKRVVVQILSSDTKEATKSVSVFENKSVHENQNNHCFRDDICKLLTSSRPTLDYGSDTLEEKDFKEAFNVSRNSFQRSSNKISTKFGRNQRRSSINPFLLYSRGPKFHEIKNVPKHLKRASAGILRAIHFLLYGNYGLCGTEKQIARTRRRILRFSGYLFDSSSTKYKKKFKSLLKMPLGMLSGVHEAIFGKTPALQQLYMANNLMTVFSNPERYNEIITLIQQNVKPIPESEYISLKEKAVSGPLPLVMLEKLTSEAVDTALKVRDSEQKKRMKNENLQNKSEKIIEKADEEPSDLPPYILKGPGKKLKSFRIIVENIKKANEKDLNLLHHLLYGRVEPTDVCKRNILEFSGFHECQNEFIAEVHHILKRLDQAEILRIVKMLCLRATTNSRTRKIMKIMEYLKKPFNPLKIKVPQFRQKLFPKSTLQPKLPISESRVPVHPLQIWNEPEKAICDEGGYRLRDFRKICSNIECSAPSDLTELNDLLFMKPSDDTEIHDRILNFTRFGFSESSIHYHYRKTLMFYMGPCIVRKIAKLLDIENWELISNHEDLSGCILNFLMEKKGPDSHYVKRYSSSLFSWPPLHSSSDQQQLSAENNIPAQLTQQSNHPTMSCQENVGSLSNYTMLADLSNPEENEHYMDSEKRLDNFIPSVRNTEDDSLPLRHFIHHPTDQELIVVIDDIVRNGLFSITLGDVVKKVYLKYAHFNLSYREYFIKSEARKIVSKLRQNAVEKMKQTCAT